ncbi:MAG: hypothetical protein J6K20_14285 [Thermoguttaceae bacterium]|nr:hypothetical protein [Thermoguttaceae bacterium]
MTTRYFSSTLAVGTLLVVFFVQPIASVSAKTLIFSHFSANVVQRDDSNASNGRGVETDSVADASPANPSGSNDSNVCKESAVETDSNADGALWLKLERNERGVPRRLATSIVRFEGEFRADDGETRSVSVDLIGAIHLGEQSYYERLNAEFKEYETVVFELVADEGFDVKDLAAAKEAKKEEPASPLDAIPILQETFADALGFVNQTDGIDYSAANLKRGDADADDFLKRLTTGGDIPRFFANSSLASLFSSENGRFEGWALAYLLAKDKRLTLRRLFADELARTELASHPDEKETALIHFRNKIAIDVAKQELAAGKTKIAVFYGAAHLDDLARRVEKTLENPRRSEPRWITAWSMESAAK